MILLCFNDFSQVAIPCLIVYDNGRNGGLVKRENHATFETHFYSEPDSGEQLQLKFPNNINATNNHFSISQNVSNVEIRRLI